MVGVEARLSHEDVCELLGIHRRTLRTLMEATPDSIPKPWVNYGGSGRGARYSWRGRDEVVAWFEAVCAHRDSIRPAVPRSSPRTSPADRPKPRRRSQPRPPANAPTAFDPAAYAKRLVGGA